MVTAELIVPLEAGELVLGSAIDPPTSVLDLPHYVGFGQLLTRYVAAKTQEWNRSIGERIKGLTKHV